MKNIRFGFILIITLALSFLMIFPSFCFATADEELPDTFYSDIEKWITNTSGRNGDIRRINYISQDGSDKSAYVIILPEPAKNTHVTQSSDGRYHYEYSTDHYDVDVTLDVTTTITFDGRGCPEELKGITLSTSATVATTDGQYKKIIEGLDYVDGKIQITTSDGRVLYITESQLSSYAHYTHTVTPISITPTPIDEEDETEPPTLEVPPAMEMDPINAGVSRPQRISIIDRLKQILEKIKDFLKDILSRIISFILLGIADGVKAVIDYAIGENVTLASIIFNHTKKTTIDYWSIPTIPMSQRASLQGDALLIQNSVAGILKPIVSYWYVRFRGIAIVCYLVLLLYLGIRMMLSGNATDLQKIKETFNIWLSGVLVLLLFPVLMKYIVTINNTMVKAIENKGVSTTQVSSSEEDERTQDTMVNVRSSAGSNHSIPLAIVYLIMLGQLIVLIYLYYKRAFMIGFLITIFPIICIKHLFDSINSNGKGKALGLWTKEYFVLVFTQLVHAVVYAVLIEGASEVFAFNNSTGGGNVIIYVLCVTFLFRAEAIVKSIFNVKSGAGIGLESAGAGVAALGLATKGVAEVKKMNKERKESNQAGLTKEDELKNKRKELENRNKDNTTEGRERMREGEESAERTTETNRRETDAARGSSDSPSVTMDSVGRGSTGGTSGTGSTASGTGSLPAGGGSTGGGGGTTGGATAEPNDTSQAKLASDLDKAKTVIGERAMRKHNRGAVRKTLKFVTSAAIKGSAATIGAAAGLATGKVSNAIAYGGAAVALSSVATNAIGSGIDHAERRFKSTVESRRIKRQLANPDSKLSQELESVGVDAQELVNNQKGEMIRKALAAYASGMVRGGESLANRELNYEILNEDLNTLSSSTTRRRRERSDTDES